MKKVTKIIIGLILAIIVVYNNHLLYIPNIELNTKYHLQNIVDIVSSITFILSTIFIFYKTEDEKISKLEMAFIIFLDIFLIISNSFIHSGSLKFIYKNIIQNVLLILVNYIILKIYLIFIKKFINNHEFKLKDNKFTRVLFEHPFICSFIILILFWLIYIIAFYPIILSPDPSFQIKQFFNVRTKYADYAILLNKNVFLTNHHPVLHTLLLGGCLSLGRILVNDNFGLFIFSLIQIILMASTMSYSIKYLIDNKVNKKIVLIILMIFALTPVFPLYALSGVKDTIYTCLVILYVIQIDKILKNKDNLNNKLLIQTLIVSIFITLFRNNGIYTIFLSFPFLMIACKKYWKSLLTIFLGVLVFYTSYTKVLLPMANITDGSIRETLSIPFQQTARLAKYYDKDITKSDKQIIDKVLGYDTLAKRYNPTISDPVKNSYNKYTTKKELINYLKVWFKYFFKHPVVYIEATLHNIYGYFSPQSTNWYVYHKFDDRITEDYLVDYHYNNFSMLRELLAGFAQVYPYIPIFGLIVNIGFNTWLLLGLCVYSIIKKKKDNLIVLSPLLITLLVCVASPVNTYFRYTMPYIFIMPFIFVLTVKRLKNN